MPISQATRRGFAAATMALCATLASCSSGSAVQPPTPSPATSGSSPTTAPHQTPVGQEKPSPSGSPTQVGTTLTQTYTVVNASDVPMTIVGTSLDGQWDGAPPLKNTVVYPGFSFSFGMVAWPNSSATVNFRLGSSAQYLLAIVEQLTSLGLEPSRIDGDDGTYRLKIGNPPQHATLTITNAKQTVHNLPAKSQAQYDALWHICNDGTGAVCEFDATSKKETSTGAVVVGDGVRNETEDENDYTYHWSHDVKITSEWDVEAGFSAGIEGIVTAEVKAKYGQSYSNTEAYGGELAVKVKPEYTAWVTHEAPVLRVTGDFTITLGNTTWNLPDVYFDVPIKGAGDGLTVAHALKNGDPGIPASLRPAVVD